MIDTVEVRWICSGFPPDEVQDWFSGLPGPLIRQPDRTDHYLKIAGEMSLGVKLRAGQIEIKQKGESFGLVIFQRGVVGRVAGWRKWGFDLEDPAGGIPATSQDTTCWTPVTKSRQLRRLQLTEIGDFEPISPDALLPYGCDLEITLIRREKTPWWTLAMEAYGQEAGNYDSLVRASAQLFDSPFPDSLLEWDSLSYPEWLQSQSSQGGGG